MSPEVLYGHTLMTEYDVYLFREGRHTMLYRKLGAHPLSLDGVKGTLFSVWAPMAQQVGVMGDFSGWNDCVLPLRKRNDGSGLWEGFVPKVSTGCRYKYKVKQKSGQTVDKADPFAFLSEVPPRTASVVWHLDYEWKDGEWSQQRRSRNSPSSPISIYELHIGSWRRGGALPNYWDLSRELPTYVSRTGFTHVEFLPVMEHPFYGSWGYQTTGYFAPTSRYGTPQDLMRLVDELHGVGIGVIFDWVPSHFPSDAHGLAFFDGTDLYECSDPSMKYHPDWNSYIFDYSKKEVRSFLISSSFFWLDQYHADGIRVDGVASMLYLDYSRKNLGWRRNIYGGNENLDAISFLKELNELIYGFFPHAQVIAEESTAWPGVTRPVYLGGLGFGLKWKMGWMHDTLEFFSKDPIYRSHHHNLLTFSIWYAYAENFVLPLSHDEVVYGKGSLLNKMPGDHWQRFANLRLLLGYMYAHPGKKLLWMGDEFAQEDEWHHERGLSWELLRKQEHHGVLKWVRDLNFMYRAEPPLHRYDFDPKGFRWVVSDDSAQSVLAFLRQADRRSLLVILNCTPVGRENYRVGVPRPGNWREVLNSDREEYGGSGKGNSPLVHSEEVASHGFDHSISLTLPALGALFIKGPD